MAQKTIVELVDDLDGGVASESVAFGLDGIEYSIDLSTENAKRLRETLSTYVDSARRVGGRKQRAIGRPTGRTGDKAQNQAIREWARSQGEKISDRGRIPAELVTRFQAANG
ncbi:histone-like nucleoid-structuring protein Lsr2 [Kutzneria sp. CA-103260]|uniref:histone-like nucleoid-structuring protein Lsr2 n=1 Tax=Kutzneria sp. CA-103260 TaxID=2802641 RepID=UPI001BAAFF9A|nr:Lsr2 family protein [Kutzneria sp. CA-103260]QUQ66328.1 lysyl tRNA synthetase-like protein [Kutzneria sp. CA-103260]